MIGGYLILLNVIVLCMMFFKDRIVLFNIYFVFGVMYMLSVGVIVLVICGECGEIFFLCGRVKRNGVGV